MTFALVLFCAVRATHAKKKEVGRDGSSFFSHCAVRKKAPVCGSKQASGVKKKEEKKVTEDTFNPFFLSSISRDKAHSFSHRDGWDESIWITAW